MCRARLAEPRARRTARRSTSLLAEFKRDILPYGTGNIHPRFFGWVHGAGNVAGAMGDMLAGFMNCNVGGRDHVAVHVERQVIDWCKAIFGFPAERERAPDHRHVDGDDHRAGRGAQREGCATCGAAGSARRRGRSWDMPRARRTAPSSRRASCWASAPRRCGSCRATTNSASRCLTSREMIAADRADGFVPAFVVASAGTVNTGAIDDLAAIARALPRGAELWLHVDAAFGGLARLSPDLFAPLAAMGEADSVAFDFHKWLQVPYDCGCVLVRDEAAHRRAFSARRDYLAADGLALAGGDPWFCEYGPEMSRGFRALKVWLTVKAYGLDALGEVVARNCRQAQYLAARVTQTPDFELLAPPSLNIVCFRYAPTGLGDAALDAANEAIVADLQASGIAAPSTTRIGGRLAIRVCLTNHRTETDDLEILIEAVQRFGQGQARRAA